MKMKKVLLIIAAALMTMTQCRKQETMPMTPSTNTIKMTVTAGSGAKTDISTETGAITWSAGDKLYVSDGTSWLGSLTLVSGADTPQGTFTGSVTGLDDEGASCHFFYLGKGNIATTPTGTAAASIPLASQDGTLRGENGAMKYHMGYGRTDVTVESGEYQGYVLMNTKIAIAHINFTKDSQPYTGSVTMGGTGVSNTLTVSPDGSFSGGDDGGIDIGGTTGERYVTLIPTTGTDRVDVSFTGDATGSMTFAKGIHENKFYGMSNAIEVTVKPIEFTVDANGTKVKFAPGNLYWDGSAFHFEANQWSFASTWNTSHVSHFYWSATESVAYAQDYSDESASTSDVFFTNSSSFQVDGETAGTWRTLSKAEWDYLLNTRTNALSLRAWKELDGGTHKGLVILPDDTDASVMSGITSTSHLASSGAVFLPAAGDRFGTVVKFAGSSGRYWFGTPNEGSKIYAYRMYFFSSNVNVDCDPRDLLGTSVRLVRYSCRNSL